MVLFKGLFGQPKDVKQKFKRTYNNSDWGLTADVVCQPSQWNKFGEVTVPAQQEVTFGSNDPTGGTTIAGSPCYVRIDSATGQLQGKIRFAITNANETNTVIVLEESTQRLSSSISDRTQSVLMPEYNIRAKEDSKLQLLFQPTGAAAVTIDFDDADTVLQVPVTVYQ